MSWVSDPSADVTIGELLPGARRIVSVAAGINAGETVVIVTDPARPADIALALSRAVDEVGAIPITVLMPVVPSGSEPPTPVTAAMSAADVILAPTSGAIYHTAALRTATAAGARFIALTGYIKDVLVRGGVFADFPTIGPRAIWLAERMTNATSAHLTAPSGTDLRASLNGRVAIPITGFVRNPWERSANPDVEAFIAPVEESINGVIVVDASASVVGVLTEPLRLTVERGQVVAIEGGPAADAIRDALSATNHPDAFTLAELAIGLNPDGVIRGVIVEDEGVAGTGHVAIGSNIFFGGVSAPPIHLDFVFYKPTLTLDGDVVVLNGVLQDGTEQSFED
jgi:2,5-dihydroxypyridine 5,6-dioxygenase